MTRFSHAACAAAVAAALVYISPAQPELLAAAGIMAGANAPDWLERLARLPHRTLFHWPILWVFGFFVGLLAMPFSPLGAAVSGFAAGGLLHLALDLGTPTGIPMMWPPNGRHRESLFLYVTGDLAREALIFMCVTCVAWGAAFLWRLE